MPTTSCSNEPKQIAQTLFLGASVASYSTSAGWGSQPSQLTVNLIEDEAAVQCLKSGSNTYNQFIDSSFSDDHYTNCAGLACYIDRYTGNAADINTPVDNRIIPGKVYYFLDSTTGTLKSRYWKKPDPGFFGNSTKIDSAGVDQTANTTTYRYDIIDTPVYFRMGDFSFGGFVQSWTRNLGQGGKQYSVIVNGPSAILNSCYVIVDKFAGSIFSRATSSTLYGTPKNYIGLDTNITYDNTHLKRGILPNVFNVYGFLESFGTNNFGGSGKNENGVSLNYIMDALSVLTSLNPGSTKKLWPGGTTELPRTAFSPFGRIISKCMVQDKADTNLYSPISNTFSSFGVIPPQANFSGVGAPNIEGGSRCQFVLDLNDLIYSDSGRTIKRLPDDIRTTGPVMSIMDLINLVAEKTGQDIFIEMVPTVYNNTDPIHIIKVRTISRLQQPRPNVIENTIKNMECNGYHISSNSFGKEKNETPARAMIIGGQQQRLYQVKSYRLAYSQSNFIYNPKTGNFINYRVYNQPNTTANALSLWNDVNQYGHGKVRPANFCTSRNTVLTDWLNTNSSFIYHDILNDEDRSQGTSASFGQTDAVWSDTNETGSGLDTVYGNYFGAKKIKGKQPTNNNDRWIPLYMDTICPFFGFVNDEMSTVTVGGTNSDSNTDHRQIRPVWFDSWTGQINVVINVNELPTLNVSLNKTSLGASFGLPYTYTRSIGTSQKVFDKTGQLTSIPDAEYFYITESEIRAALAGFDNFLVYCLSKTYKPDLIEMVRRAYFLQTKNKLVGLGVPTTEAEEIAHKETDWYWKLMGGNIGGDDLYPVPISPDKTDGSQYIQEKALQDLKLLHKFVAEVGKHYGKKYMVTAWNLQSYKDESLFGAAFSTAQGYGYIFQGDGKLLYNYTPTNDGAWEEYGNIIDDSIVVGSPEWYAITDEQGKIKPLLGYNNNYNFDHVRYAKCQSAKNANFNDPANEWNQANANPYFSFNTWLTLQEAKTTNCSDTYVFPSLDISSLSTSDYIVIDQKGATTATFSAVSQSGGTYPTITLSNQLASYNAWGEQLKSRDGSGALTPLPKSKIYIPTNVEEDYVFLDPINREYAKILIDSPGLHLYLSSEENAKDPNRTVIANVASEDLIIYLKTRQAYDYEWIRYMLSYIVPMSPSQTVLGGDIMYGTLAASSNSTANNVELAPKAAHPFFAAIPIKSNQFVYGPWINYPNILGTGIFPTATTIDQSTAIPPVCTPTTFTTTADMSEKAVNNMITATEIDVQEDFVPWNFGGMYSLDIAAFKEIETKINYQTIIETAQVEMPGLPLFNLGGSFVFANIGLDYQAITTRDIEYTTTTYSPTVLVDLTYAGGSQVLSPNSTTTSTFTYQIIDLKQSASYLDGPIISSIQTSIGQQGISTTYTFRTYTRKIGLFNKEENDRMKKLAKINMQRNKQIANLHNQMQNVRQQQIKFITDERLNKAEFGSGDLSSKLYGWSPSMVIIGQARPYIEEPGRLPKYIEDFSLNSNPGGLNTQPGAATQWSVPAGSDTGDSSTEKSGFLTSTNNARTFLKSTGRVTSTVQLYERKEVNGQLDKDYGMQSAMSLDGLLSPISFYPTYKSATFAYSLHDTARCPFCKGTKIRKMQVAEYLSGGTKNKNIIDVACDKCTYLNKKLNATLNTENSEVPINLITLNPIVVPNGEFKNTNSQNYSGNHPDKLHADLSNIGGYTGQTRYFNDRLRHCIEIVARGSVPPSKAGYALETSKNMNKASSNLTTDKKNLDYYHQDIMLSHMRSKYGDNVNNSVVHENNQRFIGLRGPLVLHSWGYDQDGYPTPNAADEPYSFDTYGRPKRFKIKITRKTTSKKYKSLSIGESFAYPTSNDAIYAKTFNKQYLPAGLTDNSDVYPVTVENDLKVDGGYDPTQGFTGDIIGKTQKWNGSRWTEKVITNDFYLNWAERPDLWKVGPIDLVWDDERKVWAGGSGGEELMPPYIVTNSNDISSLDEFLRKRKKKKAAYQHIYATLEEDLIKQPDFDETYATRAFIDDLEYSKDPLLSGYRRLIYIKDKCGYSAPRGTKLLCRYNRITGFYEPISKPVIMAKGSIASTTKATIELHYVQGRRSGTVPTALMDYANPMSFTTNTGSIGMFTFINGTWTLISIK